MARDDYSNRGWGQRGSEEFNEREWHESRPGQGQQGFQGHQGGFGQGGYGQGGGYGPGWSGQSGFGGPGGYGPGGYGPSGYGPSSYGPSGYGQAGAGQGHGPGSGFGHEGYGGGAYGQQWGGGQSGWQHREAPGMYGQGGFGQQGWHGQGAYGEGPQSWQGQGLGRDYSRREYGFQSGERDTWDSGYGQGGGFAGRGYGMQEHGTAGQGMQGYGLQGGRTGQHGGRGPKGYRRSDERIREDINEELTRHPEIDASEIEVSVQGGEVTLSGTVDERRDKRLAEDITEHCSGVVEVHNQLRVKHGLGQKISHLVTGGSSEQSEAESRSRGGRPGGSSRS